MDLSTVAVDFDRHPSVKFAAPGNAVVGRVVSARLAELEDTFRPGEKRQVVVIELEVDREKTTTTAQVKDGDGVDPEDPVHTLFCKPAAASAILRAVKAATGGTQLEDGATLAVVRGEDGEPRQPGHNGPHTFSAQYRSPARSVDIETLV